MRRYSDIEFNIESIKQMANQGDANSQNEIGWCYKHGYNGFNKDDEQAVQWFTKSAKQGNGEAMFNLGLCYLYGEGVIQNSKAAAMWLGFASEHGITAATVYFARCFLSGVGIEQDLYLAVVNYKYAAKQGNSEAQVELGYCYSQGIIVEENKEKAFELYKKSALQGNHIAQTNLGKYYEEGDVTVQSYEAAVELYSKASEFGDTIAMNRLGHLYELGLGVEKNERKAFELYYKSANLGDLFAIHYIGYCYEYGIGVEKCIKEAEEWYAKAVVNGDKTAKNDLIRVKKKIKKDILSSKNNATKKVMRIFTILLTIAFIVASCNQKQVSENDSNGSVEHETIVSLEPNQDSLAFWTDDEILSQHGDLVDVAQYIWRINRNDSVSQNIDFFTKEVEQINPKLLAYFDKHHKSNNISEAQKIDSVLNEIKVAYEPMVAGSTMSSIVGLDVHTAVDSYREALLFNRLMLLAQNDILRAALRDEMVKWKIFELNLTSYVSSIARLCFWGGSLSGPASLMANEGVLNSRIEDQNNLCAMLFGKKIVQSADPLKQVEAVFRQSIEQALDSVSHEDHSEMFAEDSDSLYVEKYKESQNLQNDIKNSLSQWLKTRERLGFVANLPQNEYQMTTAKFLANLSKEITAAATY